ncbi:lysophospholipid acyltransferase family protein [Glaciecola sp. SC05]|uniref:lysophospholipid acyltransferase family protein n=1 Tax=Glaciecola sp. SC05 TaxID=1987355 RepID=UPI00352730A7
MSQVISINNLVENSSWLTRLFIWLLDRVLGIARMNQLYQLNKMQGLSKESFADKLIALLELRIHGLDELKAKIPVTGPVVIASNHPFGGIEGVILARAIGEVRPDLKVLANKGLGIFRELSDYFIFTNPLSQKDPKNGPSLRRCIEHVKKQHALLIFPAGKVSYFQAHKNAISEHQWNKIVGRLISIDNCQYVPVFVSGENSRFFYRIERIYFRLRMFLLGRELLNKTGAKIEIASGFAIPNKYINDRTFEQKAAFARTLSYAQDPRWRYQWPADTITTQKPLAQPVPAQSIRSEIDKLPANQLLTRSKGFEVYFVYQHQAPLVVQEIARLRELVFRLHNEGSGEPIDTDKFDASYTHLFILETDSARIVGAYRMGLTDKLIEKDGLEGLYLNNMFKFGPEFANQNQPAMEMGRSFLIPEYQGSYQGLLLLWRGIGAFVCLFPQYRTLYGTVSISKLYDARSVNLIQHLLISKNASQQVSPRHHMHFDMHPEISEFCDEYRLQEDVKGINTVHLSAFLKSIEHDGKDIPILAKQYFKMGAQYHALGIDTSFNHTPGLLLSVELPKAPKKLLQLYLGDGFDGYQQYKRP